MNLRILIPLLLLSSAYGQTVNPNQIRPSTTDGQVLTTTGGQTVWGAGSGGAPHPVLGEIQSNASPSAFGGSGIINSEFYRSPLTTGENGVANAIAAGVKTPFIQSGSTSTEIPQGFNLGNNTFITPPQGTLTQISDYRNQQTSQVFLNPCSVQAILTDTVSCAPNNRVIYFNALQPGNPTFPNFGADQTTVNFMTGGWNTFPQNGQPAFKTNMFLHGESMNCYTNGQCNTGGVTIGAWSFGDNLIGPTYSALNITGGCGDNADECKHAGSIKLGEATGINEVNCTSGCTTGSTTISVSGFAQQMADYTYMYDESKLLTPSCTIASGLPQGSPAPSVTLTGSSCMPLSTMFLTTAGCQNNANYPLGACGLTTVAIATSGLPTGFATTTAGLPSTATCYAVDDFGGGANQWDNEATTCSVVDSTHISINYTQPHVAAVIISIGGAAGGLFFASANSQVNAGNGVYVRQGMPILGYVNNTVYFTDHSALVPVMVPDFESGSTESNVKQGVLTTTSVVRDGSGTITVAGSSLALTPASAPFSFQGLIVTLAGLSPSDLNGTCTNAQVTSPLTFTCSQSGASETASVQGTATGGNLGFQWGPAVQIKQIMNATTKAIDGSGMILFPNNSFPFTNGEQLFTTHHPHMAIGAGAGFTTVGQILPFIDNFNTGYGGNGAGIATTGMMGPHFSGFQVDMLTNVISPDKVYVGYGNGCTANETACGLRPLPKNAYSGFGYYSDTMDLQAGENAAFHIACNNHGCGDFRGAYRLFALDTNGGGNSGIDYFPALQSMGFRFFDHSLVMGNIAFTNYAALSFGSSGTGQTILTTANIQGMRGTPTDPDLYFNLPLTGAHYHFQFAGLDAGVIGSTLWSIPALQLNSITGSTQCAQFDSSGNLSGTGSACGSGGGGGGVSTFTAPSGSWPTWLVPTVTNASTTPQLTVAAGAIPNSALANATVTIGSTSVALGATVTTFSGVTLSSPTLTNPALGTPSAVVLTNGTGLPYSGLTGSVPTWNQNTTGSAAKWTTARNLAGNSVDGSANVAFANKFIVQGTTDAGLSGAQFLGALATGLLKNTTSTGVLTIAAGGTDYVVPGGAGTVAGLTTNFIPKAASATVLANSLLSDNATTLAYTGTGGFSAASLTTTGAGGGSWSPAEGTAPSGSSGVDIIYADSTLHSLAFNPNNAGAQAIAGTTPYVTLSDASPIIWATAGVRLPNATVTLNHTTGTRAINLTGLVNGSSGVLVIKQDSTGGAAITGGTGCTWLQSGGGGSTFTITLTANSISILTFSFDGSNCYASIQPNFS